MEFIFILFIFVLGTIIGSFLNVVILRLDSEKSIVNGRSACPKCKKTLKWYELVPVLSWIFLLGKCGGCKKKISVQYPLVELATGVLFVLNYNLWNDQILFLVLTTVVLCLLVVIFVYDLYHKIIPDRFSYTLGVLGLIHMFLNFSGWDLLAPVVFFLPFYLLWRISDGTWIGLGDGKLAFGFGGFLGLIYGLSAIVLSFWIGAVFAIGLMLLQRLRKGSNNITMKSEIPFGPFMIIAFLLVYFWKIDVIGISSLINVL
jgi:leader peptidase (prepilin peptidase)/N-methyltransferase